MEEDSWRVSLDIITASLITGLAFSDFLRNEFLLIIMFCFIGSDKMVNLFATTYKVEKTQ